jgi:hypothetical protein
VREEGPTGQFSLGVGFVDLLDEATDSYELSGFQGSTVPCLLPIRVVG